VGRLQALLKLGHGDIISVQGQTFLSLSWTLLYKIGMVYEFVSAETPDSYLGLKANNCT